MTSSRTQLFLLHFAGGNSYSFQPMLPHLKDFQVVALELPGRGRRMDEKLLNDFDQAAADQYHQIISRLAGPSFFLYGHSMGAYLALRVAGMLERAGHTPLCLFVSGNPGPGIRMAKKRYLLENGPFIEELRSLGGISEEFLGNPELFELFEPILRADFEVAERNLLDKEQPVGCPLYAFMGHEEENVDDIRNWGRFTRSTFNYKVFDGNHFFIHQHARDISVIMRHTVTALSLENQTSPK